MNLSAACLLSGDYTNAVKWTYLAEDAMEQLETSADKSLVEPHWGMSILVNRLNAQMHLGMEEAARETAERLDFHVELLLRYADLLEVVVAYAVSRDDLSFFQAHMPELSKLAQIDSAETVRRLRGHATLFSPWREAVWGKMPVDSVWNAVRGIPNRLGTQLLGSIEQVRMEATHEPVPKPSGANFPVSAAATFAVLSVLLVLGAGIRTLPEIVLGWRWNVLEKMPDEQLIEVVAHAQLASGSGIQEKLAKYAVVEVMRRRYQEESLHTVPGFSTLTDREREFVHHLVQGKRAKEFAQGKSLSTGYIYNLSSHIRQKLQVPENQEIATWISRQRQGVR
jgi:DNA-binding CsgD family transcriptional regulator